MRVLIADDSEVSIRLLQGLLREWGYDVVAARDGKAAWDALQGNDAPSLAILDWEMPELTGPEVCGRIRSGGDPRPFYLILLTSKEATDDIITGLRSGADDYLTKPFHRDELQARIQVGVRVLSLQADLAQRIRELEEALEQVHQLKGIVPICMYCKKIRDDRAYWHGLEQFIEAHSEAEFSHGVCPDCFARHLEPQIGDD